MGILATGVYTIFAINIHRIVLIGEKSVTRWGVNRWTIRESLFFLHLIGVILLFNSTSIFFQIIKFLPATDLWLANNFIGPFFTLIFFFSLYVVSRVSFCFPGLAIDKCVTFYSSWKLTKNHKVLMIFVTIFLTILFSLLSSAIGMIPYIKWLSFIIDLLGTIIAVACLSLTYKSIYEFKTS